MDEGRHLGAVVLAAGASTRLGQPKQLVRLHGQTLVERAVRIARDAGARTIFVVLGANYQPVFNVLQPYQDAIQPNQPELRLLLNKRWAEGMGTSVALAAAAAERHEVDDLLVLTCDQVSVTAEHLRELVAASHREHVVASTYQNRRGVPALFPSFSFHRLQQLNGDRGARDLLQGTDVVQIPLPGGELDIDTPEDLSLMSAAKAKLQPAHTGIEVEEVMSQDSIYTRERALALLHEWTQSPSLLKHAHAVEICTASYGEREAARLGLTGAQAEAFVLPYRTAALLHDFDYERHPSLDEHVWVGSKVLEAEGWPEPVRHAILAHASYTNTPRESHLDRALFACDELSGFLTACALVKPTKSIHDVEVAGVRKKMKDKAFARGVLREDMTEGAELLGIPVDEHIGNCLRAMQDHAAELGLAGLES